MDKIKEKLHIHGTSDSDAEKPSSSSPKTKVFRLFGRDKSLHQVLGGGKPADVFLWRNKKISGGALAVATAIWIFFELLEYHFLTLICHGLILLLAGSFLWSNATTFIHKSPATIPKVSVPEKLILQFASALSVELNQAISTLREVATGREVTKFLAVIAALWVLSSVGSCFNFLTLAYIVFVLLHTVPVLYERYEDQVDSISEKAIIEIKKQYKVLDAKVLSKIPRGSMKDKKKV